MGSSSPTPIPFFPLLVKIYRVLLFITRIDMYARSERDLEVKKKKKKKEEPTKVRHEQELGTRERTNFIHSLGESSSI